MRGGPQNSLIELAAVDRVGVTVQVDRIRIAGFPPSVDGLSCLEHLFPVLSGRIAAIY